MKSTRMLTILVLVLSLVGNVWAENGPVKFRATVTADEQHDVIPICYGDYFVQVSVDEVLEDAGAVLTGVTTVEVCYERAHGFTVGNEVEVYGYYWGGGICPRQYCGRVAASSDSYYIELASLLDGRTAFTYQGRLNESGEVADGLYDFRFTLYDHHDPGIGEQLGDAYYVDEVEVVDGYFTVMVNFGAEVFNGEPRWLEIAVKLSLTDMIHIVLEPRQQITPTPYALYAETGAGDNDWVISPLGEMFSIPSGNVGIGTSSPMEKLHVVGNVRIEGASPAWLNLVGGFGEDTGISYTTTGVGVNKWEILRDGSSSNLLIREAFPYSPFSVLPVVLEAGTGNVGIGTTEPAAPLHVQKEGTGRQLAAYFNNPTDGVDSEVEIQFGLGKMLPSAWSLKASSGLFNIANVAVLPPALSIRSTGRVGIGTTEPAAQLDVRRPGKGRQLAAYFSNPRDGADSEVEVQFGLGTMLPSGWSLRAASGLFSICNVAVLPPALNITSTGNVGIGTTSPEKKLHVAGGAIGLDNSKGIFWKTSYGVMSNVLFMDGSNKTHIRGVGGGFEIDDSGGNPQVFVSNKGDVGIGTIKPSEKLHVNGKVYISSMDTTTGGYTVRWHDNRLKRYTSSARYKEDIQSLQDDFDKILESNPKSFIDKASNQREIGFIAEEFDNLGLDNLVIYDRDGQPDALKYELVSVYLLEVIKDQVEMTNQLKAKNQSLERRVEALEKAIQQHQYSIGKEVQQ